MDWRDLSHVVSRRVTNGAPLALLGAALAVSLSWASPAAAQLPELRSSHDGVYTEEQASEGLQVYQAVCSNCHNESAPLWGSSFLRVWAGQPLWRLYEFLSLGMPYGAAGSLSTDEYTAVTAYILKMNGYPAGDARLPQTPLEIAFINLDPHD